MTKKGFLWNYIKSRLPLLLLSFCLITCAVASMVYGKYVDDREEAATLDIIAEGELTITVTGPDGNLPGEYTITNDKTKGSTIPAYVRFAVVVNWQDGEGNLWAVPPTEGTHYTVTASDCTLLNNYYYYNGVRNPGDVITVTVTPGEAKAGYTLHVQIVAEGIQSVPLSVAESAWHATYNGSEWVVKS